MLLRFFAANGDWLDTPLKLERVTLRQDGHSVGTSRLEGRTLWHWYVAEISRLFKSIDRQVCGGALANQRITDVGQDERYGICGQADQIAIVPAGYPEVKPIDAAGRCGVEIAPGDDVSVLASQVLQSAGEHASFQVGPKSPLVYANLTRRDDGREFLTIINHDSVAGTIEVGIGWPRAFEVAGSRLPGKAGIV